MKYKRILLKLSGEALVGDDGYGIDPNNLKLYANEIKSVYDIGAQIAIVIGGGNIFRGAKAVESGIDRVQGDYMGMLATVINSMALQAELEKIGIKTALLSGMKIGAIAQLMTKKKADNYLKNNYAVIIASGTGNPFFTTDSAAALRAAEIEADCLIKGTKVDGVYSADPFKDKNAIKFNSISFDEVIEKKLKVMDMTAFTMCQENKIPIIVFNINNKNSLRKIVEGELVGTVVE